VDGLKRLVATTSLPVYALGGIAADTASQLANTGIIGLAAVEALAR
jgi:thiamine-phosphate pyrophosphorylase